MAKNVVVSRNAANTKVFFTQGGVEYELPNIENVGASGRTRNSRDIRAFQQYPITQRIAGWIDPDNARVNTYYNPSHPAWRALQKLWPQQTPTPWRIEQPEVQVAQGTNFRVAVANGLVTFGDAKAGVDEVLFDYKGYNVGLGCMFTAASKNYLIDDFDADGRAETSLWPTGTITAVAADTAYTVSIPKLELKFAGFLAGESPQFDNDAQAMCEIEIMISGDTGLYIAGTEVK